MLSNPLWDISVQVQIGFQRTLSRSPSESGNFKSSGLGTEKNGLEYQPGLKKK